MKKFVFGFLSLLMISTVISVGGYVSFKKEVASESPLKKQVLESEFLNDLIFN